MPTRLCLLVTDHFRQSILRFDTISGAFIDEFVPGSAELSFPSGVRIGADGNVFVSSGVFISKPPEGKTPGVLRYRASDGIFMGAFAADGQNGLSGAAGLEFGQNGNLYVGSGALPYWNDPAPGSILRYHANTGAFIDAFVPTGSGGLVLPHSFAFGPDGHLYACQSKTHDILRFDGQTGALLGVFVPGGSGGLGYSNGLAFGPDDHLYVSSGNRVLRYDGATGAFIDVFISGATSPLSDPRGLLFGPASRLYVCNAESGRVLRFDAITGAYIDSFVSPKGALPSYPIDLTVAEMDFPLPSYAQWRDVPRYLWAIAVGIGIGVIVAESISQQRRFRVGR